MSDRRQRYHPYSRQLLRGRSAEFTVGHSCVLAGTTAQLHPDYPRTDKRALVETPDWDNPLKQPRAPRWISSSAGPSGWRQRPLFGSADQPGRRAAGGRIDAAGGDRDLGPSCRTGLVAAQAAASSASSSAVHTSGHRGGLARLGAGPGRPLLARAPQPSIEEIAGQWLIELLGLPDNASVGL